jgi:integrase
VVRRLSSHRAAITPTSGIGKVNITKPIRTVGNPLRRYAGPSGAVRRRTHRRRPVPYEDPSPATELLRGGTNIRVVQELMRHESLTRTQIFTEVTGDERRDAIRRLVA